MGKHYEEDYEGESFEKFSHRKGKGHKKGHQSRSANSERKRWATILENEDLDQAPITFPKPNKVVAPSVPEPHKTPAEHQFGDNTHEIKGIKIDFDGVADIQKIDNVKDGRKTYGIKFLFKGKKGLFRIIWFNSDLLGRDTAYNAEYAFWLKVRK